MDTNSCSAPAETGPEVPFLLPRATLRPYEISAETTPHMVVANMKRTGESGLPPRMTLTVGTSRFVGKTPTSSYPPLKLTAKKWSAAPTMAPRRKALARDLMILNGKSSNPFQEKRPSRSKMPVCDLMNPHREDSAVCR